MDDETHHDILVTVLPSTMRAIAQKPGKVCQFFAAASSTIYCKSIFTEIRLIVVFRSHEVHSNLWY